MGPSGFIYLFIISVQPLVGQQQWTLLICIDSYSPLSVISRRKWLPQPWRKLSQGQVDKPVERPLLKKSSDKRLKVSTHYDVN